MANTVNICTCRLPHHTCYTSKTLRLPSPHFQNLTNTPFPSVLISPVPIRPSHDLCSTKYSFGLNFAFPKSSTNINPVKIQKRNRGLINQKHDHCSCTTGKLVFKLGWCTSMYFVISMLTIRKIWINVDILDIIFFYNQFSCYKISPGTYMETQRDQELPTEAAWPSGFRRWCCNLEVLSSRSPPCY